MTVYDIMALAGISSVATVILILLLAIVDRFTG